MSYLTLSDVLSLNPANPEKFHVHRKTYSLFGLHFHIEHALEEVFQAVEPIRIYGERFDLIPLHAVRRTGWSFRTHTPVWNLWESSGPTGTYHVFNQGRRLYDVPYTYTEAFLAAGRPNWNPSK
jgi:hypothetical protein